MADTARAPSIAAALDHPSTGGAIRCGRVRTACDGLFRSVDGHRGAHRRSPDRRGILADRVERRSVGPFGSYTKTLFVQFRNAALLRNIFETSAAHYSRPSSYILNPHLSLIYKKLPEDLRRTLCETLDVPMANYAFDRVRMIETELPIRGRRSRAALAGAPATSLWKDLSKRMTSAWRSRSRRSTFAPLDLLARHWRDAIADHPSCTPSACARAKRANGIAHAVLKTATRIIAEKSGRNDVGLQKHGQDDQFRQALGLQQRSEADCDGPRFAENPRSRAVPPTIPAAAASAVTTKTSSKAGRIQVDESAHPGQGKKERHQERNGHHL